MASQRRSLCISLSGELLVLGVLLLIPLAWTDRIPHLDWRSPMLIGPPTPARPAVPSNNRTTGHSTQQSPVVFHLNPHIGNPTPHVDFEPAGEPPGIPSAIETGASNAFAPIFPQTKLAPPPEQPKIAEQPKQPPPAKAVIVSKGAQLAKLIHQVKPIYPPLARAARISGTVQLLAVIAKDGTIHNLQTLSGNPLLVRAALDAVSQWVYRPTLLSGEPVEVTAPIEVSFILTQ
jgi:periplasmic protein TonB